MSIWTRPISVEDLTKSHHDTAPEHLGLEFLEVGPDFIRARVPVDKRTRQPYGLIHGGVSVVLAETLGSCGAIHCAPPGHRVVGLDINEGMLAVARTLRPKIDWCQGDASALTFADGSYDVVVSQFALMSSGPLPPVSRDWQAVFRHAVDSSVSPSAFD